MEVLYFWMSAYLPQVVGFAVTILGMQTLLTVEVSGQSNQTLGIVMGLLFGWLSAVFGSMEHFKRSTPLEDSRIPTDPTKMRPPFRVYWVGLAVFVLACAIPIGVNVFDHGWTQRNFLGAGITVLATLFGCAKGLWDARVQHARKSDWPGDGPRRRG